MPYWPLLGKSVWSAGKPLVMEKTIRKKQPAIAVENHFSKLVGKEKRPVWY
jgi:hypothetical protein